MAKKAPIHYIAFPDKSWIDAERYANYPSEHRLKLDGCACMLEQDFKSGAYRDDKFWNPVTIGKKISLPKTHFIVWRAKYKSGRTSVAAQDKDQFASYLKKDPNHFEGAACVRAVSIGQAEAIAQMDIFWNPVDGETIARSQEKIKQEKAARRSHYPEVW